MKGVADVPIASFAAVSSEEFDTLHTAAEMAFTQHRDVDAQTSAAFHAALLQAIDEVLARFNAPGPALFIVQEEDWRWILPMNKTFLGYSLVRKGSVGSREVLLMANREGAALVQGL